MLVAERYLSMRFILSSLVEGTGPRAGSKHSETTAQHVDTASVEDSSLASAAGFV